MIKPLTEKDVELRVAQLNKTNYGVYVNLLVYKDARVDMRVLDETYGPTNWQRRHEVIDGCLYCTISIWDAEKGQWVSKQDVGTESYTEKEKGQASDSFKRAGFCWGIGRELYNAPHIRFKLNEGEYTDKNNKVTTYEKFKVAKMEYDSEKQEYTVFDVVDKNGNVRFSLNTAKQSTLRAVKEAPKNEAQPKEVQKQNSRVKEYNGQTCVLLFNKWRYLANLNTAELNVILHDEQYATCHAEAKALMNSKKGV